MESVEEAICLVFLWPWAVFIIFFHLFSIFNVGIFWGFAEWGLPVIYGFLLLLEHLVSFGLYITVYLVGSRGRASLVIGCIEDLVAAVILLARVALQSVRGVIVGMFHFIAREAALSIRGWHTYDAKVVGGLAEVGSGYSWGLDLVI